MRWALWLGGATPGQTQEDFDCGLSVAGDDRLLPSLELDPGQMFFKTITRTRRQKKPMALLVVGNPDDEG